MRRGFTCLTAGRQRVLSSMAESVFWKTRIVPLWSRSKAKQQKELAQRARGRARFFFLFLFLLFIILFISFILFNYVLTFLKDARERGAHDDCQSPLPGQVGPGLTV